jgi:RNA recognition motif-containing protein
MGLYRDYYVTWSSKDRSLSKPFNPKNLDTHFKEFGLIKLATKSVVSSYEPVQQRLFQGESCRVVLSNSTYSVLPHNAPLSYDPRFLKRENLLDHQPKNTERNLPDFTATIYYGGFDKDFEKDEFFAHFSQESHLRMLEIKSGKVAAQDYIGYYNKLFQSIRRDTEKEVSLFKEFTTDELSQKIEEKFLNIEQRARLLVARHEMLQQIAAHKSDKYTVHKTAPTVAKEEQIKEVPPTPQRTYERERER